MLGCCTVPNFNSSIMYHDFHGAEDESMLNFDSKEMDHHNCWSEFSVQSNIILTEYKEWMCIPMLWIDVLVEVDPLVLPVSFYKAVFWARSRFSMVESETSAEGELPLRTWISSSSFEISGSLGWKVPTGSDDGRDRKESKNSVEVCTTFLPLIKTFSRLTTHFLVLLGQGELRKQWTWEPRMGETLVLSLFDSSDKARQFGKHVLEQISSTKGLSCGLEFLCSSEYSLSAIFLGLRHALRLVQMDSIFVKFQNLHHFFFILRKLLLEGDSRCSALPKSLSDHIDVTNASSQGGFLRQPIFDALMLNFDGQSSKTNSKLLQKFSYLLSKAAWPSIWRLLVEGKAFLDYSICQMTCVRILEIIPIVFERFNPSLIEPSGTKITVKDMCDFNWLHDLMDWGKSSLKVVVTYWKRTVIAVLNLLKESCSLTAATAIGAIENLVSIDDAVMDELTEKVAHLTVLLSKKDKESIEKTASGSNVSVLEGFPSGSKFSTSKLKRFALEDVDMLTSTSRSESKKEDINEVIVLSDDESKERISAPKAFLSESVGGQCTLVGLAPSGDTNNSQADSGKSKILDTGTSKHVEEMSLEINDKDSSMLAVKEQAPADFRVRPATSSFFKSKDFDVRPREMGSEYIKNDHVTLNDRIDLKVSSNEATGSMIKNPSCETPVSPAGDAVLKQIVCDSANDPLEFALNSAKHQKTNIAKSIAPVSKRQVIQLKTPAANQAGYSHRHVIGAKRFKPPRLDCWYKSILELDYFAMIGLASVSEDKSQTVKHLKEVPVCFQSPEQYVEEIFRPLILEEFKAQLHSSFVEMSSLDEMYLGSLSVLSVERIDDFHLVRFAYDDKNSAAFRSFAENDLILLTKELPQKSAHGVHVIGKVFYGIHIITTLLKS